jgi:fructose-1,6-bisphosphatase/inositol monophosphatase family enzyme
MDVLFAGKYRPQAWWDIAGGWAVIEAAGGVLRDLEGQTVSRESTQLVAGHPDLVEQLAELFAQYSPSPERRDS